jgi:hypothetical protein
MSVIAATVSIGAAIPTHADGRKGIALIAGPDSHGSGMHEHYAGMKLAGGLLNENVPGVKAEVFKGVHAHGNWAQDDFRKLLLNAMVWIAGAEVPDGGVKSQTPTLAEHGIRAIPYSKKYVATADAHHGQSFGSLMPIDQSIEDDGKMSQVKRITPDALFPERYRGTGLMGIHGRIEATCGMGV